MHALYCLERFVKLLSQGTPIKDASSAKSLRPQRRRPEVDVCINQYPLQGSTCTYNVDRSALHEGLH